MTDDSVEPIPQKSTTGSLCKMEVISAEYGSGSSSYVHIGVVDGGSLVIYVIIECLEGSGSCSVGINEGTKGNRILITTASMSAGDIVGEDPAAYVDKVMWTQIGWPAITGSTGVPDKTVSVVDTNATVSGSCSVTSGSGNITAPETGGPGGGSRTDSSPVPASPGEHYHSLTGNPHTHAGGTGGSISSFSGSGTISGSANHGHTLNGADHKHAKGTLANTAFNGGSTGGWSGRPLAYWVGGDSIAYMQASGTARIRARVFYIASGRG